MLFPQRALTDSRSTFKRYGLFCACDDESLCQVDLHSGEIRRTSSLSGHPDVIFYNSKLAHLCVTIGDPAVIEVFDTRETKLIQRMKTEPGTHTIAFNPETSKVYAFMPESHRASVYIDE